MHAKTLNSYVRIRAQRSLTSPSVISGPITVRLIFIAVCMPMSSLVLVTSVCSCLQRSSVTTVTEAWFCLCDCCQQVLLSLGFYHYHHSWPSQLVCVVLTPCCHWACVCPASQPVYLKTRSTVFEQVSPPS